jgi:hypothetical protein
MKLSFYGKRMVRLEMTEKQLDTFLAALDLADGVAEESKSAWGSKVYQDIPPMHRYLVLLYRRANKARNEVLS